jgi:hypothetical protein
VPASLAHPGSTSMTERSTLMHSRASPRVSTKCREDRSALDPHPRGNPRTTASRSGHQCPRYHGRCLGLRDLVENIGDVDLEPPHPAVRNPPRSCHGPVVHVDRPYPLAELGAVAQREQSSLSPAVPPACHKQRAPAVSSGQPLNRTRPVGRAHAADLGWGRSAKLHGMQGVRARFAEELACPSPR